MAGARGQFLADSGSCTEAITWLSTNCDTCLHDFDERGPCIVQQFGPFGEVDHTRLFYGIYKTTFAYEDSSLGTYDIRSVRVFEQSSDSNFLRPVLTETGADFVDRIEAPYLISSKEGSILHIFMTGGNGGFDFGYYFLRDHDKWQQLNIPEWPTIFKKNVPDGYSFCRGGFVDFTTMKVGFPVFRPDDPCCCPTGGWVTAGLLIHGHDVLIDNAEYSPKTE